MWSVFFCCCSFVVSYFPFSVVFVRCRANVSRSLVHPVFVLMCVCHSVPFGSPFFAAAFHHSCSHIFLFSPFLSPVLSAAICFTYFRLFHLSCFRFFARHSCLLFPPSATFNSSKPSTLKPSNSFLCRPSFSSPLVGLAAGMHALSAPPRPAAPRPAPARLLVTVLPPRHLCAPG